MVEERENEEEVNFWTREQGMGLGASVGGLTSSRKETFLALQQERRKRRLVKKREVCTLGGERGASFE